MAFEVRMNFHIQVHFEKLIPNFRLLSVVRDGLDGAAPSPTSMDPKGGLQHD